MTPPPPPPSNASAPAPARPARRETPSERERFRDDVLTGLRRARKRLPCKWFYDQRGSELFDRICERPEYYLTRSETAILQEHADEIARRLGEGCALIEYGSGSSTKTRLLLDHLIEPHAYVPIDISRAHLMTAAQRIARAYPHMPVMPLCADYTGAIDLPASLDGTRRVVFFPGSTIGNFEPEAAVRFLRRMRTVAGAGGGLLIGVDLKKDPRLLHAAYNDAAGVTAEFNLNLLVRINRELEGDFDLDQFAHHAFYNPRRERIEMHLLSRCAQTVHVAGEAVAFRAYESVFTESSYKYTPEEFQALARRADFRPCRMWTDDQRLFSVHYLKTGN